MFSLTCDASSSQEPCEMKLPVVAQLGAVPPVPRVYWRDAGYSRIQSGTLGMLAGVISVSSSKV